MPNSTAPIEWDLVEPCQGDPLCPELCRRALRRTLRLWHAAACAVTTYRRAFCDWRAFSMARRARTARYDALWTRLDPRSPRGRPTEWRSSPGSVVRRTQANETVDRITETGRLVRAEMAARQLQAEAQVRATRAASSPTAVRRTAEHMRYVSNVRFLTAEEDYNAGLIRARGARLQAQHESCLLEMHLRASEQRLRAMRSMPDSTMLMHVEALQHDDLYIERLQRAKGVAEWQAYTQSDSQPPSTETARTDDNTGRPLCVPQDYIDAWIAAQAADRRNRAPNDAWSPTVELEHQKRDQHIAWACAAEIEAGWRAERILFAPEKTVPK